MLRYRLASVSNFLINVGKITVGRRSGDSVSLDILSGEYMLHVRLDTVWRRLNSSLTG